MKFSQRLTRAGLTFILLGSVAAVMPQQNQAVRADTCTTNGTSYRLTSDPSGATDITPPVVANHAEQNFYVFKSTDGGNYAVYTPESFTASGAYSGSASGNTFNGTTNNTTASVATATLQAVVPSGTLRVSFTVSP